MTGSETTKIVWVCGASSGIGAAVARLMAQHGCIVAASARSTDKLTALAAEHHGPGRIVAYPLDVTDEAAVQTVVARIGREIGLINVAVLSAGAYTPDNGRSLDMKSVAQQINTNVLGTMNCVTALIAAMKGVGGHIALIASVAGYSGLPRGLAYGGSKAALINMAEALEPDCRALGIKLQIICPGFVRTPLTDKNPFPMPFLIEVPEAAAAIVKGLQSSRFEIAFPWQMKWGLKLLKRLPYWMYLPLIGAVTGANKNSQSRGLTKVN